MGSPLIAEVVLLYINMLESENYPQKTKWFMHVNDVLMIIHSTTCMTVYDKTNCENDEIQIMVENKRQLFLDKFKF